MTRQQMKQKKEEKKAAKLADKLQQKQERQELKAWDNMVARMKLLNAWID